MNWIRSLSGSWRDKSKLSGQREKSDKPPLIILTGPTAVGKTGLSIELAKRIGGEIISADSMQVYRGMDVGTAKVTKEEMDGVPHHLIDILEPTEAFDVTLFQRLAGQAVQEILGRGKLPILVGGTGFYIQALLYGIDFTEEDSGEIERDKLRCELEKIAETPEGLESLVEELRTVDPKALLTIHPNNKKRVIRAVEYFRIHQAPISAHNEAEREKSSVYNSRYFVLTMDREKLYQRIEQRIDIMLEQGLVSEVRRLHAAGCGKEHISMQGIGYKEILEYLDGETTYEEAVTKLRTNTRHYAKRQLTWFRREKDVIWLDKDELGSDEEILQKIILEINNMGISHGKYDK